MLSVVIPAYDELPSLRELVPRIHAVVGSSGIGEIEILIVVRSTSGRGEDDEILKMGAIVVHRGPSDSFGDAMRSGLDAVSTRSHAVVTMDADGSHDPERIPALVGHAHDADIVIASRYVPGGRSENTRLLRFMSRTLNLAYSVVLGIQCHDISTNFKLFKREDVTGLRLTCQAFDVVEEIVFRVAQKHGPDLRIVEIPDNFHVRMHGVTKRRLGPFIASYLVTLGRLRLESSREQSARGG